MCTGEKRREQIIISCGKLLLALLLVFSMSGCFNLGKRGKNIDDPLHMDNTSLVADTMDNFADIKMPTDMKYNSAQSMSVKTDSFKGGIFQYSGRIETNSLREFIIAEMQNSNWKLVGAAHYENVLIAFVKPNQTCMVVLTDGIGGSLGKTYVTMYITADRTGEKHSTSFLE